MNSNKSILRKGKYAKYDAQKELQFASGDASANIDFD